MINYSGASEIQKDHFFGLITGIFKFYVREGEKHYRIIKNAMNIIVRESSQEPPLDSVREIFQTIMTNLKEMGLFEYTNTTSQVNLPDSTRFFSVPSLFIDKVNTELMDELLDIPQDEIPIQVPESIQRYMANFSPILQEYIKKCLQENLREEFESNPSSIALMSISASPIALTRHLEIPVRLPNLHLGVSNEHYDLLELLNLRQNLDGTRNDPITRQPFNLSQILPAPDIFEQIKNRMLAARGTMSIRLSV